MPKSAESTFSYYGTIRLSLASVASEPKSRSNGTLINNKMNIEHMNSRLGDYFKLQVMNKEQTYIQIKRALEYVPVSWSGRFIYLLLLVTMLTMLISVVNYSSEENLLVQSKNSL